MNDIQKAIDEGRVETCIGFALTDNVRFKRRPEFKYAYTPSELKSLLEQVALKSYMAGQERQAYHAEKDDWIGEPIPSFKEWKEKFIDNLEFKDN